MKKDSEILRHMLDDILDIKDFITGLDFGDFI